MMTKTDAADLAIDRALAAVREADGVWSDLIAAAGSADVSVTREEQRGLRAALAILKAARVWADDLRPWVNIAIPNDSHSLVMNLYRTIQGRSP